MSGSTFLWLFIASASILDLVGLFYLWRRRQMEAINGWHARNGIDPRLQIPVQDRRRHERRRRRHSGSGVQTSGQARKA